MTLKMSLFGCENLEGASPENTAACSLQITSNPSAKGPKTYKATQALYVPYTSHGSHMPVIDPIIQRVIRSRQPHILDM
jgi:hypothetical protein